MGCCNDKPIGEKLLEYKENLLQFKKLTAHQIHEAFQSSDDFETLSYSALVKILGDLKITYSESDANVILKPFLSVFQKESIKVDADEEYDHRMFKAIMIIMSNGSDSVKAKGLFESFDVGHNNSLGAEELDFMLRSLLYVVDEIGNALTAEGENFTRSDVMEKVRNEIFDKIVRRTEKAFFEGETSEILNPNKFVAKMALVKNKLGYDFLSTSGIRKSMKEWVLFKDSIRKNETIQLKHK